MFRSYLVQAASCWFNTHIVARLLALPKSQAQNTLLLAQTRDKEEMREYWQKGAESIGRQGE